MCFRLECQSKRDSPFLKSISNALPFVKFTVFKMKLQVKSVVVTCTFTTGAVRIRLVGTKDTRANPKFPDWPPRARTENGTALCH
jgi:hypothetical protein